MLASAQPCSTQSSHEFTTLHGFRALCDRCFAHGLRQVIVVEVKSSMGNPEDSREIVEFLQGRVTDEVAPHAAVIRPVRVVHEDRHGGQVCRVYSPNRCAAPYRCCMTAAIPQFDRLDNTMLIAMGAELANRCLEEGLAVTIVIKIGQQRVFHAALPGTSADNDAWADRKLNTVARFGVPSLELQQKFPDDAEAFFDRYLLDRSYAPAGGAVPIFVGGVLVGGIAVSGLASEIDHELALGALLRATGN